MASTSSSATIHYKHDLFLSFRGEDTRNSFTDHLYKALLQAGINTFRDDDQIGEGQELKPEIERSIRESRASIVVFSENFANSSWCLDELSLIFEQMRNGHHFVLPVFYKVDPSDVRNQRERFSIEAKEGIKWTVENVKRWMAALREFSSGFLISRFNNVGNQRGSLIIEAKEGTKWTEENVKRWKEALREVANLKGIVVSGSETTIITEIVNKIYHQLDLKLLSIPTNLAGIETRAGAINTWLKNEQPVIAICGMGGIGKTTLAKYIYNSNKHNFDCSSFLEGISDQPGVMLGLQKQLLRDVSGNNILISNVSEGTSEIENAIQRKRALIVVDDIDDQDQLSTLFGTTALHNTQSKIIITTRLLNIDTWFQSISYGCQVHKVELLNPDESLELLSYHAFGSKIPTEGFEDPALRLAQYCEGNPLALKVLGSSLMGTRIETWRSTLNSLNSSKGDLHSKIQGVLQKSYDTLPCDSHKELFLHIACLFLGEDAKVIKKFLEDDYYAESGMVTLNNRCLLTFSGYNRRLTMHKLLQDMAGKIVRTNSKDRAERSKFVWCHDDCCSLLRKGNGSKKIEGLVMHRPEISETFETSSLVKMKNLKYLQLDYVKLTGSYENFPDLRWLRWNGCNMKTIPPGLLMSSLVVLDMRCSYLEEFNPPKVLNSLRILNLGCCNKLVSICNLTRLPKLETLFLYYCTSLTNVCKTIGDLENLSWLSLAGCTNLWKASSNEKFVNQQERLKTLCISCFSLGIREQPLCSLPQSLSALNLFRNTFEILPRYIDLKMVRSLYLSCCTNLKSLPCLPSKLEFLYVDWCSSLENITFESGRFTLSAFSYEGCFKLCEVQGLFKLVSIKKLDEADLGQMLWIKAYEDHKVDLSGDVITEGRIFNIQMLYEYGIKSTYLQGIKDQSMKTHQYTSSDGEVSFRVPLHPKNHRIQGLNVTTFYRPSSLSSSSDDITRSPLFAKIKNITKGVAWAYGPVVFCKPRVDEDVVWLSYWPIKNIFDTGDEVHVRIYGVDGRIDIGELGVSLVYMDDDVEVVEKGERMDEEEVIGGDMSRFEVNKGSYYLCRKDFFKSMIPDCFFGDKIEITDSQRWRRCFKDLGLEELNAISNPEHDKIEVEFGVSLNDESKIDKIEKAVSSVVGVESVNTKKEIGRLYVSGRFDPQAVISCVREFEKMVQINAFNSK